MYIKKNVCVVVTLTRESIVKILLVQNIDIDSSMLLRREFFTAKYIQYAIFIFSK